MTEQTQVTEATPKRARGRTVIGDTPVTTRSRVPLQETARRSIEQRLRRALTPFGPRIERASIRFEDLNGPRGGVDLRCAIKVVFSGSDSVIVEEQGASVLEVVRRVMPRVGRIVRRHVDASGKKTPRATRGRIAAQRERAARQRETAGADGTSARTRRVRRTIKQNRSGMTYALEEPAAQPSRKSTRASGNRIKAATQLTRRAQRKVSSPSERAARSQNG